MKDSQRGGGYNSSLGHDVLLAEIRQVCRTDVSQAEGIVRKRLQDVMPINRSQALRKGIYIHYESYVAIYRRFSVQHDYYTFYINPCLSMADWQCTSLTWASLMPYIAVSSVVV